MIVKPCNILIPKKDADLEKYACVACDQFTSDENYWNKVEQIVGSAPSTFRITFPEIYLSDDNSAITDKICKTMCEYLEKGFFRELTDSIIFVERIQANKKVRKGLVVAIDLEEYEYKKGSRPRVRATEGTIEDRLPPRVEIRKNAPLELPHIMILIDDKLDEVFSLVEKAGKQQEYSVKLMMDGGILTGYSLEKSAQDEVLKTLDAVTSRREINYAVGDGNHSLATAKKCWENLKQTLSDEQKQTHPARYALCEIVNLYDSALEFEPIHRVLFNVNEQELLDAFSKCESGHSFEFLSGGKQTTITIPATHELCVGSCQTVLDEFLLAHPEARIDYVHEADRVKELSEQAGVCGILLPAMEKTSLFDAVEKFGSLPRKTFSMGEGKDKRYYFEARKIL